MTKTKNAISLLFVSAEVVPFSKTGGLGDVSGALPGALRRLGCDIRVLTPVYGHMASTVSLLSQVVAELHLPGFPSATLRQATSPVSDYILYFLDCAPLYQRPGTPYQSPAGEDWPDNDLRFALLARAGQEIAQGRVPGLHWRPQVVHANDWQTALLPYLLALEQRAGSSRPGTLLTIHNLAYQGLFPAAALDRLDLPKQDFHLAGTEFYGKLSFLKAGILYADHVNTVSPTYAQEIQTPAYGMGMDSLLRQRRDNLSGILNGIDTRLWNPEQDPYLPVPYSSKHLAGKRLCKQALQAIMGLPVNAETFLTGTVGRVVEQKGLNLILANLPQILAQDCQFVLLGNGDHKLERQFQDIAAQFPQKIAIRIGFDEALSHQIEAGLDLFMMPSRFEPCGLNQIYSLRYGTPPLVRRTGGLADTVVDSSAEALDNGSANGFTFEHSEPEAFLEAFQRAHALFRQPEVWQKIQQHGMTHDFGWDIAARQYASLYQQLAHAHTPAARSRETASIS